ncbi:MAG TPA: type II toxin-antitoxin system ParD family antitoxin [Thermomicrobiales bacterium]|jgi:putative addiction module CopG family antidote
MNVTLSPQSEHLLRQMVDSGRYHSTAEVLEEALFVLDEQHRLEQLRAMVAVGEAEIERGEYDSWSPELSEQITQQARELAHKGHVPDADVCP